MSITKFKNLQNEDGFTLADLMIGMIVMSLLMLVPMVLFTYLQQGPAQIAKTFNQFEQWSIANPVEAAKVTNTNLSYLEASYLITGEDKETFKSTVSYIPLADGNYDFCITPVEKTEKFYRYSSETQEVIEDETCTVQ